MNKQTNYVKGRTFEYKIATFFRRRGYFVVRAAGSHGPADLVAMKKGRRPLFIQCKKGSATVGKEEHNKLFGAAIEAGAYAVIAVSEDRKPTIFKAVTGVALKAGDAEVVAPRGLW
jgi:Holliday junction resolvase